MILPPKSTTSAITVNGTPIAPKTTKSYFAQLRDKSQVVAPAKFTSKPVLDVLDRISESRVKDYSEYWTAIAPADDNDFQNRWLFSFLSVHCGWKANVKGYMELTKPDALASELTLRDAITVSGVGLIKMRTAGIWKFKQDFQRDSAWWRWDSKESWVNYRYRLMNNCYGLAHAKTAFAIEMCYPTTCDISCLDTHMLQLYGQKEPPTPAKYATLENHWVTACRERNIPPAIARHIYWDTIQKKSDCRYWTYLFEKQPLTFGAQK